MKKIAILGGGTVFHVRPHLALSAPAYGSTARSIKEYVSRYNMPNLHWKCETCICSFVSETKLGHERMKQIV